MVEPTGIRQSGQALVSRSDRIDGICPTLQALSQSRRRGTYGQYSGLVPDPQAIDRFLSAGRMPAPPASAQSGRNWIARAARPRAGGPGGLSSLRNLRRRGIVGPEIGQGQEWSCPCAYRQRRQVIIGRSSPGSVCQGTSLQRFLHGAGARSRSLGWSYSRNDS